MIGRCSSRHDASMRLQEAADAAQLEAAGAGGRRKAAVEAAGLEAKMAGLEEMAAGARELQAAGRCGAAVSLVCPRPFLLCAPRLFPSATVAAADRRWLRTLEPFPRGLSQAGPGGGTVRRGALTQVQRWSKGRH